MKLLGCLSTRYITTTQCARVYVHGDRLNMRQLDANSIVKIRLDHAVVIVIYAADQLDQGTLLVCITTCVAHISVVNLND